jgi:hypothetical protein
MAAFSHADHPLAMRKREVPLRGQEFFPLNCEAGITIVGA